MVLNLPANSLRELRAICPVSLTYLFAKQVQQSSEQFVCGGLGVLALLGIGESLYRFYRLGTGVAMRGIKKGCRSILLRSHPDSNWSKRFCRPVPNHSAMEPCCECKGSTFVLNYQTLSEIFAKSGKNEAKVR